MKKSSTEGRGCSEVSLASHAGLCAWVRGSSSPLGQGGPGLTNGEEQLGVWERLGPSERLGVSCWGPAGGRFGAGGGGEEQG